MRLFLAILIITISIGTLAENSVTGGVSGKFTLEGGKGRKAHLIEVFYYLPSSLSASSQVLMVLPGGGRNGWDYRDSWIESSEKYDVVILSPSYSDEFYPRFWNYNLAGMLSDVIINKQRTAIASFKLVQSPSQWIFLDFDRIFLHAIERFDLAAKQYDMFGHSAGGQILHRLALFHVNNFAGRILASNSGWYTVPTFNESFPYGLANGVSKHDAMAPVFGQKLTVFLGELDNAQETKGHLVRNSQVDRQGTYRLSRGIHFFSQGKDLASQLDLPFYWNLHIVKRVGHDYKKMGQAAAQYLYSGK